jgi:hypothetical protein
MEFFIEEFSAENLPLTLTEAEDRMAIAPY